LPTTSEQNRVLISRPAFTSIYSSVHATNKHEPHGDEGSRPIDRIAALLRFLKVKKDDDGTSL
jgi:hypothetical protein